MWNMLENKRELMTLVLQYMKSKNSYLYQRRKLLTAIVIQSEKGKRLLKFKKLLIIIIGFRVNNDTI